MIRRATSSGWTSSWATYNAELLHQTAKELKDQGWLAIYTRMAVLMCKKNVDNIRGRVLLQTLPSKAYDTEATIAHVRLYDQEFARAGIGRDRYCIKIPSTGSALNAAKTLSSEEPLRLVPLFLGCLKLLRAARLVCCTYFNGEPS